MQQKPLTVVKSEPLPVDPQDQAPALTVTRSEPLPSGGGSLFDALRALAQATGHGHEVEGTIGGVKSLLGTIEGGGQLIRNAMPWTNNLPEATLPISTQPSNSAQAMGKTAGDVAQFFAPAGAVRNTALALKTGIPAVNLGVRALLEGGAAAGVHSMQQGTTEGAGTAGALSAAGTLAGPVIGATLRKAAPGLKEAAEKKVAQALGATKEKYKAITAKRAPEILERGIGGSRKSMLANARGQADEAGQAVDDVLQAHGKMKLPTATVHEALETAKSGYMTSRSMSLSEASAAGMMNAPGAKLVGNSVEIPVVLDERAVENIDKLQALLRNLGDEVEVDKLVAVRRVWDEVVDRAGGYAHKSSGSNFGITLAEGSEAWAKKQGATALRKLFAENVPDITKVNAEFSFWADLSKVLRATEGRTQPQGQGLKQATTAVTGAVIGGTTGGLGGAAAAAVVAPKVFQMMTSPRWRMVDARLRNKLADALMNGNPDEISALMGRAMAAITSSSGGEK
jgi:hypothetical protein